MEHANPRSVRPKDLSVTHGNAPLSVEGCCRLVRRCRDCPIARVAAEMGISRLCVGHVHRIVTDNGACYRARDFVKVAGPPPANPAALHHATTGKSNATAASGPKNSSTPANGTQICSAEALQI